MSNNDAATIADLALKSAAPVIIQGPDGRSYLIAPNGVAIKDVTDPHGLHPKPPAYIEQGVVVQSLDSLVGYADRYKTDHSVLFADIMSNSITAALDYHRATGEAAHVAHRVTMVLPFSEEWKLWTGQDGKLVDQLTFARFLEENHPDIAAPNAAELIEMARDLHAARNIKFTKVVRTDSDNENFTAEDTTTLGSNKNGGGLELPKQFTLRIPVYFGEPPIDMTAFLRWKVGDQGMQLGIKLWRAEHVRQAEFKQIVVSTQERTSLPAVYGKLL